MNATPSTNLSSPAVSSEESSKAALYLMSTRDGLIRAASGLSHFQYQFKPTPDEWSIVEILEHVVIVEERIHALVQGMPTAPAAEEGRKNLCLQSRYPEASHALHDVDL